jgi:hypothetical protein
MTNTFEYTRLKWRMYFFVPYNISPIQQAIQAGHAALEYACTYGDTKEFKSFIENDKTWIILNGGTTNSKTLGLNEETAFTGMRNIPIGTLNQILRDLTLNKIQRTYFVEPDLNDAITAVCFLADERVWDFETHIDFYDWLKATVQPSTKYITDMQNPEIKHYTPEQFKQYFPDMYTRWAETVLGGEKNEFLRNLIRNKKLA